MNQPCKKCSNCKWKRYVKTVNNRIPNAPPEFISICKHPSCSKNYSDVDTTSHNNFTEYNVSGTYLDNTSSSLGKTKMVLKYVESEFSNMFPSSKKEDIFGCITCEECRNGQCGPDGKYYERKRGK